MPLHRAQTLSGEKAVEVGGDPRRRLEMRPVPEIGVAPHRARAEAFGEGRRQVGVALDTLLGDETTRNRFAENGLARLVSKGWTWDAHGERLADIHRAILDGDWDPSRRPTPDTHTDLLANPT